MIKNTSENDLRAKLYDLSYQVLVIESLARVINIFISEPANLESYDCENLISILYDKIKFLRMNCEDIERNILS